MITPHSDKITAALLRLWDAGPDGISRGAAACTPAILKELRAHGCLIEESPGGSGGGRIELQRAGLGCYRDLIEALAARHGWPIGRNAVVYHRTTSTNDVCLRLASNASSRKPAGRPDGGGGGGDGENSGGAAGIVAIADVQSRGRGRRGRAWSARPGQSVLMSILLRNVPAWGVDRLTLLAGLAGAEALESILQGDATVKAGSRHGRAGGGSGGSRGGLGGASGEGEGGGAAVGRLVRRADKVAQ